MHCSGEYIMYVPHSSRVKAGGDAALAAEGCMMAGNEHKWWAPLSYSMPRVPSNRMFLRLSLAHLQVIRHIASVHSST